MEASIVDGPVWEVDTVKTRLALLTQPYHMTGMNIRQQWLALGRIPAVRTCLFVLGLLLMVVSPLLGVLPGPGGIVVFAAGLALTLKYSELAQRHYVLVKRKHPKKGAWADWGMRRRSFRRREAVRKEQEAAALSQDD